MTHFCVVMQLCLLGQSHVESSLMMLFLQEGGEGDSCATSSVRNYLHAVLCESWRGRQSRSDCLHLLQLHPGVLPGASDSVHLQKQTPLRLNISTVRNIRNLLAYLAACEHSQQPIQWIFICMALFIQKVAQSASQRLKTTTEIKNNKENQENKIKRTQPSQICTDRYTNTYTLIYTLPHIHTHTHTHTHTHIYTSCH